MNPTFNWVRLAQRVPVRIQFDQMPEDVRLVAGRTATVSVKADGQSNDKPATPAAAERTASHDKVALAGKGASTTGVLQ